MLRNTASSWGRLSRWFHWGLGFVIIGMLAFGWWMNHISARPDRLFYRSIHADIGYLVLLLMVLRLIWRGINPAPALPSDEALATALADLAVTGRNTWTQFQAAPPQESALIPPVQAKLAASSVAAPASDVAEAAGAALDRPT